MVFDHEVFIQVRAARGLVDEKPEVVNDTLIVPVACQPPQFLARDYEFWHFLLKVVCMSPFFFVGHYFLHSSNTEKPCSVTPKLSLPEQ
jgi:hypothetical protein